MRQKLAKILGLLVRRVHVPHRHRAIPNFILAQNQHRFDAKRAGLAHLPAQSPATVGQYGSNPGISHLVGQMHSGYSGVIANSSDQITRRQFVWYRDFGPLQVQRQPLEPTAETDSRV